MTYAATLAVGLVLGVLGTWWVVREEIRYLRRELTTATDRLIHARLERGAEVPPRPIETPPPPPLPPELQEIVNQWESPESRMNEEIRIRGLMERGYSTLAILKHYENQHP